MAEGPEAARVADLAALVVVAHQLLDHAEAEEIGLLVGGVEQRRHGLGVALLAGEL